MTKEQIKKLKGNMEMFLQLQGERREQKKAEILAYLDGCLDGLDY